MMDLVIHTNQIVFFTNDVDYVNKSSCGSITGITIINGHYDFYQCHYDTMYVSEYYKNNTDKIENQGISSGDILGWVYKFHLTSGKAEIYTKSENAEKTYEVKLTADTNHFSNDMPIHLFARPVMEYNLDENINSCEFSGKYNYGFHYFKAWRDGELISNIVPQKNSTHWRLYDTVRDIVIHEEEL